MASKTATAARLFIRRGLSEPEAALYVGIGSTKFRELVQDGRMPKPRILDGRKLWDVEALDAAFRDLPMEAAPDSWADL